MLRNLKVGNLPPELVKQLNIELQNIREGRMSKEVEERLKQLRANLAAEPDKKGLYASDLKASIESCEKALQTGGYRIVGDTAGLSYGDGL